MTLRRDEYDLNNELESVYHIIYECPAFKEKNKLLNRTPKMTKMTYQISSDRKNRKRKYANSKTYNYNKK